MTKTADVATYTEANQTITYTIVVKNTGATSLTGVTVADSLAGVTATYTSGDTDTDSVLDVGETWVYTAAYTTTQADVDGGLPIENIATVDTDQTTPVASDPATTTNTATGSLSVTKTADVATYTEANQTITYTIVVKNTGATSLTGVTVADSLAGVTATYTSGYTDTDSVLDVGETWVYTAAYTTTQADVDGGLPIENIATVDTDQTTPVASDPATTTNTATGSLSVTKTADVATYTEANQTITYTIVVKNTGATSLTGVTVADSLAGVTATYTSGDTDTDSVLDVGETWVYTAAYTTTQADVDGGLPIENIATVDTDQTTPVASDPATTTNTATGSLSVTKTADVATYTEANQTITYTIVVKNAGATSLTGVTVADSLADVTATYTSGDTDTDSVLDVGETWVYTAAYTTTQADVDGGLRSKTSRRSIPTRPPRSPLTRPPRPTPPPAASAWSRPPTWRLTPKRTRPSPTPSSSKTPGPPRLPA